MKIGWVLGWAVPEPWFAPLAREAYPQAEHRFYPATARALTGLAAAGPFDHLVGYSLGAQLLLGAAEGVSRLGRVALLAPIFSFAREDDLGGRVARAQVRHLLRWLRREPGPALADFYQRAHLDVPLPLAPLDALDDLAWGLERLAQDRIAPPLPAGWSAYVGADDALLDAARLHVLDASIAIVPGATHHPRALIRAWAERRPS